MKLIPLLLFVSAISFCQTEDTSPRGLAIVFFANLGTPLDGKIVYCPDCTPANPTAGGGTGAVARRENGAWNAGGASGGATSSAGLTDCLPVRASGAVLTMASGCPIKNTVQQFTANSPATLTSSGTDTGTVWIWVDTGTGALHCSIGAMSSIAQSGFVGPCDTATGIVPALVQPTPLFSWTITSGAWDTNGYTNLRALLGHDNYNVTGGGATPTLAATGITFTLPASNVKAMQSSFTGNGSAIPVNTVTYFASPIACTLAKWYMTVDTGTATMDVWKIATGTAIPTVVNTITASALPAVASGTAANSGTLTGWTTAVSVGDIFGENVKAVSGATLISLTLECDQ